MDEQLASRIGGRIRAARVANHQTQAVVAGLSGITTDYLYQVERGKKLPTITVLVQLAAVLRAPLGNLVGEPTPQIKRTRPSPYGDILYRALTQPTATYDPPPVADLCRQVDAAWRTWQTSPHRYSQVTTQLPGLITGVTVAERQHQAERRAAHQCAADLYGLLRTVAKRVNRLDLALLVADRAIRAAEAADDPLRLAAARWNLGHVLMAGHEAEGAETVVMRAADTLRPLVDSGDLDATAVYGSLVLLAAVASVRRGDVWTARDRVAAAAPLADRTGERNVCWTAFGPTNVAMHAVSVEVEAGDAAEALRLADRVGYDRSPSIERRVAFLLEQAKGYEQRRDYANTLVLLQTASREAPEDVAQRPTARKLLETVIQRGRRSVAAGAVQLADHVGLTLG